MGVVAEAGFSAKDLSEAVALDRMEMATLKQVRLNVEQSIDRLSEGRVGKALGLLRAALVGLDQVEGLDMVEMELLVEETPGHIYEAQGEGREIIGLCQPTRVVA